MPTGDIVGTVKDESGGVVQGATVTATNTTTGMIRTSNTEHDGTYRITVLPPGEYELRADAEGFQSLARTVVVRVGRTTTVNIQLPLGILQQVVEAFDALPEMSFERYSVDGVVSRFEIENLPLNGREFLQLSVLEPGVTAAPMAGFLTRQFDVSVLGGSPEDTPS